MQMHSRYHVEADTLVVDLGRVCPILSSAPRGGGFLKAQYILNHQVPSNRFSHGAAPDKVLYAEPSRYLGEVAKGLGLRGDCVGLMTAVPLKHMICAREETGMLWVECFCTVGLSNAVRAGEFAVSERPWPAGTINIILVTNARLPSSAMAGALQVLTESKTAMVLAAGIESWTGAAGATGTGTDAAAIASGCGPHCRYSGTHTPIGGMIGRVVGEAVRNGIVTWRQWRGEEKRIARGI
jgi:adenosylcobinamide hydrolase